MSADQINLISNILKDLLKDGSDGKSEEIANLIVAKLKEQQKEKEEVQRKKWEKEQAGLDPNGYCTGCRRANPYCGCTHFSNLKDAI